ncbi:MAG: UDP-N-acetylmuramoyl-L-alanine--D-glutamate ligase [Bacteroidia bacterium]|nr:UDP-N-acetylmuramoyl-L-alanine--D-glutamate ligase [Bacteroidia bacterium]
MSKRAVILGAAESGTGAALLAKQQGYEVFVSDFGKIKDNFREMLVQMGVEWEEGGHTEGKIMGADVVIKSPGIPEKAPIIKLLRKENARIVSEVEFASWFTKANLIGITGSNGKTTTTSLLCHTLSKGGLNVACGGNIGTSFAGLVAQGGFEHYVLEISNFQLDDIETFRPHIAVLLNITEDHLDRYEYDVSKYADAKFRIAENLTEEDYFIINTDDPLTMKYLPGKNIKARILPFGLEKKEGNVAWFDHTENTIHLQMEQDSFSYNYDQSQLMGRHNVYNTMAASIVARVLDLRKDSIRESFSDFRNVEHRLEKVACVGGIQFINDSKATNVNAAWYALESVDAPIVWIVGGVDKGNDYSLLMPLVEKKVKSIVALGDNVMKIHKAFSDKVNLIINALSMKDAVQLSYHLADKNDTVLLSPACASFDLFENYEDRGRQFKKHVREL